MTYNRRSSSASRCSEKSNGSYKNCNVANATNEPERDLLRDSDALKQEAKVAEQLGLGGGLIPKQSLSVAGKNGQMRDWNRARLNKLLDISNIIPVNDVRNMTQCHWKEILLLESKYVPVDWSALKGCCIFGECQPFVTRDHRHRIVKWMSEACALFRWSNQTFYVAVHAWDYYITHIDHEIQANDLARLSAACLYFGAQLIESASDENVKTLQEFAEMCPEVGTTYALRETQAHLVDLLQGVSLVRRTPTDILLLYLAQMQIAPDPCPKLFKTLLERHLLDVLWELALTVCLTVYTNGLILDGLPGSRWVAGAMLRVLEFLCPDLRTDAAFRESFFKYVFHLPQKAIESFQDGVLDPIIKSIWRVMVENLGSECFCSQKQETKLRTKNYYGKQRTSVPYDVIRHKQLPTAKGCSWPETSPNNKIVQEASLNLRKYLLLNSGTPPAMSSESSFMTSSQRPITMEKHCKRHEFPMQQLRSKI